MALFIILESEQAALVRGFSTPSTALDPVERQGGVFILGVEVLADPAHAANSVYLGSLPQIDDAAPDFPPAIESLI